MKKFQIRILFRCILVITFLIIIASCGKTSEEKFNESRILYNSWVEFHEKKDEASCRNFINTLEQFVPENFSSDPVLNDSTQHQMEMSLSYSYSILELIESKAKKNEQIDDDELARISASIEQIDLNMLAYLRNQNYYLEEIHGEYYSYFKWVLVVVVVGGGALIYLNAREVKKRDKIIYNSEQFLRHSMEVQEAERRRISRELHDTVAQNMRYVSLLAENLEDKNAANNIISSQNQNIQDIRKLCYNLTPPNISSNDMVSSLELMGQKLFETTGHSGKDARSSGNADGADENSAGEVDIRIVSEDAVDFSVWNADELMNIYRIVQEAFQNINKHAEASEVTVLFKAETATSSSDSAMGASGAASGAKSSVSGAKNAGGETGKKRALKIIITDDGKGMSEELVEQINSGVFENTKNCHFGIRNIVERVQLLGGTVAYRSEPNYGTQITVVL